jgi:hypothetical protein
MLLTGDKEKTLKGILSHVADKDAKNEIKDLIEEVAQAVYEEGYNNGYEAAKDEKE